MSVNISRKLAALSDVIVRVDLNKLGPRQRTAFNRMVQTGIVIGYGIPAQLASKVLSGREAAYVRIFRRGRTIGFYNTTTDANHPLREAINTATALAIMADSMSGAVKTAWERQARESRRNVWDNAKGETTYTWLSYGIDVKPMFKIVNLKYEPYQGDSLTLHY